MEGNKNNSLISILKGLRPPPPPRIWSWLVRPNTDKALRKSVKQVRHARDYAEAILRTSTVPLLVLDKDLRVVSANDAFYQKFKSKPANTEGYMVYNLGNGQWDIPELRHLLNEVLPHQNSFEGFEVTHDFDDIGHCIMLLNGRRLDVKEGGPERIVLVLEDITEQKQAEMELKELNENLEERTKTLTAYQAQLRKLADKLSIAEEEQRRYLATELHDNLGQLLTVAKMKLGSLKKKNNSEDITESLNDLDETLNDSVRYTRQLMSELKPPPGLKGAEIEDTLYWLQGKMKQHELNVVIEDGVKAKRLPKESNVILQQSIRELLYNVVKHSGVKEAHIVLNKMDGMLKIEIKDNGKGFESESEDLKPTTDGGFGLFNIKERLEIIGGKFNIKSKPGEGTTATLLAPLKVAQEATGQEATGQEATIGKKGKDQLIKVLLVDDHQVVREGLQRLINEQDDMAVVTEAANGEEALKSIKEVRPDVILMDINMPVMDGIEATTEIMGSNLEMCIIGLSVHASDKVEQSMRKAGARAYITKDKATETLCAIIRSEYEALRL